MRTTGYGRALVLLGFFAACGGENQNEGDDGAGATGGAQAGAAGNGGTPGRGAAAGSSGKGGASGASGALSGAAGINPGGAAGVAGAAGASGIGTSGGSGQPHHEGGAAGHADVAGASGTAPGEGGNATEAGAPGVAGGETSDAGSPNVGGAAGHDAAGAAGASGTPNDPAGLSWSIDCIPNETCTGIGYPDIDEDGVAFDCGDPGYFGHHGTDIGITEDAQAAGTAVRAAADGVVLFAFDGKYDRCPDANEPDCQDPPSLYPGSTVGNTVCTPLGPYCGTGEGDCFWCFAGGNVIVIRHSGVPGVFATRYDHLKRNSFLVEPGDTVTRGQKIAEAASAGASTAPHLHFEVWGTGFYELADPWAGACGPNTGPSLWAHDPPWSG